MKWTTQNLQNIPSNLQLLGEDCSLLEIVVQQTVLLIITDEAVKLSLFPVSLIVQPAVGASNDLWFVQLPYNIPHPHPFHSTREWILDNNVIYINITAANRLRSLKFTI